jgi:hypothetical protein
MGISSKAAQFLMELALEKPFSGSIMTLGVQELSFFAFQLSRIAQLAGFSSSEIQDLAPSTERATDMQLFRTLGFSEIRRTDVEAFEGAELLLDLNSADGPPAEYRERFDCVLDGGTLEHVFHVPNALANIFHLTKVGGRIIHMNPAHNYVDHGFYSFSPTFFVDYYTENGFIVEKCLLFSHTRDVEGEEWIAGEYTPGSLDEVHFGGLDDRLYDVFFVATKTEKSTCTRIPQQGTYRRVWKDGSYEKFHAESKERKRIMDAATKRPEWLQRRFDQVAVKSARLTKWLRRPSERKDFPLAGAKRY